MKHKRLNYSKIRKASPEEVAESIRIHKEYARLGISVNTFTSSKEYSNDELMAMELIVDNKQIPEELEKRLLHQKKMNEKNNSNASQEIIVTDEEVEDFLR